MSARWNLFHCHHDIFSESSFSCYFHLRHRVSKSFGRSSREWRGRRPLCRAPLSQSDPTVGRFGGAPGRRSGWEPGIRHDVGPHPSRSRPPEPVTGPVPDPGTFGLRRPRVRL